VEIKGYEVVNKDVLKDIQISKNSTIRIFLAKKERIEAMKKGLLKVSQTIVSARKDSIFHLLNLQAAYQDKVLEKLEGNFGQNISDEMEAKLLLNQFNQELEKELPSLVDQMVSVNLDFASDRYKNAIAFFQENKLDQAIEILDGKELDTAFENILASIDKAKETPKTYQKIRNIRRIQIENVIESFNLKRTLLKLAFRVAEAENLIEKIDNMKALIKDGQPVRNLKADHGSEDIATVSQVVNILLQDTLQLAQADTNWVKLEMEKLVSKGGGEEEMEGEPKAKTILETLPYNAGSLTLGIDFENTLLIRNRVEPDEIPIYEQPTPEVIPDEKVLNTKADAPLEASDEDKWLAFSEVVELEIIETPPPAPPPAKEIKKVIPTSDRMVYNDVIEPNYSAYKITKKTSLRQRATASSKVLKRLKVGTKVKVIDQVDRYWSKVILNGEIGYVKVLLLEKSK
jgi:hypothetical protein